MKSTVEKLDAPKSNEYPKLKLFDDGEVVFVVLFDKPECGMTMYSSKEYYKVGEYSSGWDEKLFKDFHDKVILEN